MAGIPDVSLSAGCRTMPLIGMGTAVYPFGCETMRSAIIYAIEIGYRHFDTAAIYQSEQPLGDAIAEALLLGLINSRDELFITSKLSCNDGYSDRVRPALEKTLKNLGLEYLDLYLIHFPVSLKPGVNVMQLDKEDIVLMDFKSTWAAMEECQRVGLTRSIGVSNFSCKKLTQLLSTAEIPPAVNQVSLRWVHEQGVSMLVKSFNKQRLTENLQILDWSLSKEELHMIDQIPQRKGFPCVLFVSDVGPYKTLEELWDGEI
ncbi:NADPH-dependent codeinone reductase 1-1-like isoform X2 [Magnolia sinica]|uniref:NADPH-dependent codeinone reductase 1-1-like isoform X2 n=1 Tax=Magnolia sinica TaxID=86752 RepID=UPI00265B38F1|nr:NADPH-dependent codeinone reductase 1-1-like isoform X2 [Magnolia sinica]